MRIAVKCPNWVGDVIMATPALQSVRESFPDDEIYGIVRPGHFELVEGCSSCDELIKVDETGLRVLSEGLRMREHRFDMALILPRAFRAALLMWLSGAERRLGFAASGRSALLTETVDYQPRVNTRDMYLRLCEAMGCKTIHKEISLPVRDSHEQRAEEILSPFESSKLIGLVPGGAYGSAKLWPVEHFGKAASMIREKTNAVFVVLHGPGEETIAQAVKEAAAAELTISEGLGVLKSLVKRLDLLLTNDTGPRHVGIAFGVPTVVLMGPTRTEYTDYPAEKQKVLREKVECGPCQRKKCPRGDVVCMRNLLPERVAEECLEMMESFPRES